MSVRKVQNLHRSRKNEIPQNVSDKKDKRLEKGGEKITGY